MMTLAGCTVQLVSDYDDQIDSGLTQANTDITAFVTKMGQAAGTPAGEYAQNKDFYPTEAAKLSSIRVRAEAHRALHSCPTTAVIKSAVMSQLPQQPVSGPTSTLTPQQVIDKIPQDDCGVLLIVLIQDAFGDLQAFHQAQGARGIPASATGPILSGGLGSLLHSAIQVEIAKKAGTTTGVK